MDRHLAGEAGLARPLGIGFEAFHVGKVAPDGVDGLHASGGGAGHAQGAGHAVDHVVFAAGQAVGAGANGGGDVFGTPGQAQQALEQPS